MTRPRRLIILSGCLLLAGGAWAAVAWSREHIRSVTGRSDPSGVSCLSCHGREVPDFTWEQSHPAHPDPAGLALSGDETRLYVACPGTGEVLALDCRDGEVLARVEVPDTPFGLALDTEAGRLYVTCRSGDRVEALQASTLQRLGAVEVGREPVALAVTRRDGFTRLVVANSRSDDVSILGTEPLAEITRLTAGRGPSAVAVTPTGDAVVANRLARVTDPDRQAVSEVTVLDPVAPRIRSRPPLHSAHLAEGVALMPGSNRALVPVVRTRNLLPITQVARGWVMTSALAVCDLRTGAVAQVPLDELNACYADPSGVVVDPATRRAFVASGGGDAVSVVDLDGLRAFLAEPPRVEGRSRDDDLLAARRYVVKRIPTGANPRHMALAPRSGLLFVAEHLGDAVLVVDTRTLKVRSRLRLVTDAGDDPVSRGARVFASARFTFQGQFSCRSCHPEGHADGLTYDFDIDGPGRNILENRSLRGVGGTAPFKWNGKNPSLKVQCGARFAKVLTRTAPIHGRDLDDLVAYIRSLPPVPPRTPGSSAAAARGRRLFFAERGPDGSPLTPRQRCSTCHPPPLYTNGLTADVGTRADSDDPRELDVPHLLGIGSSAPYLHDGRARTLEEIWTVYNPDDLHGATSTYSKHDLNDLVEFLRSL